MKTDKKINKDWFQGMIGEVRQNLTTIDNCPRHRVSASKFDQYEQGMTITCEVCGGKFTRVYLGNYIQGYKAAGGDPNDIVPGWEKKEGE